ncbi:ParB/RepB/Spo0J family partition protein [Clavibacter sp. VKM Ac-2872]|uniref:ParB/RepB/Spo0J family partition protein n=1 Tax=Clavibacter sp. VKM Ac-2872 TaxID=2783812 RepID=UPI00351BC669
MTITENTTSTNGVTEYLDPNTLIIEENVRPSADLTREFVRSITANGVLTPVLARRDVEGRVLVRAGQRRTLAAREVGLTTIPVHIIEGDDATAERIVQQLVENDQRSALTDVERTVAFKQLSLEGMSMATISKRTGTGPRVVKKTLRVANTPSPAAALTDHQLTLDQAAALVEFDEYPEIQARLIETARTRPAQFDHELRFSQQERARKQAVQAAISDHESRGYVIVDPQNPEHADFVPVRDLVTVEGGDALLTSEKMDARRPRGARGRLPSRAGGGVLPPRPRGRRLPPRRDHRNAHEPSHGRGLPVGGAEGRTPTGHRQQQGMGRCRERAARIRRRARHPKGAPEGHRSSRPGSRPRVSGMGARSPLLELMA